MFHQQIELIIVTCRFKTSTSGNSLAVQWLGPHTSLVRVQLQYLVGELCELVAQPKKLLNKWNKTPSVFWLLWKGPQSLSQLMRPVCTGWPLLVSPAFSCLDFTLLYVLHQFFQQSFSLQVPSASSFYCSVKSYLLFTRYSQTSWHFPAHLQLGGAMWLVLLS